MVLSETTYFYVPKGNNYWIGPLQTALAIAVLIMGLTFWLIILGTLDFNIDLMRLMIVLSSLWFLISIKNLLLSTSISLTSNANPILFLHGDLIKVWNEFAYNCVIYIISYPFCFLVNPTFNSMLAFSVTLIFFDKIEKLCDEVTFNTFECQFVWIYCFMLVRFSFICTPSTLSSKWISEIVTLFTNFEIIGPMFVFSYLLKKSDVVVNIIYGINDDIEILTIAKKSIMFRHIIWKVNPLYL